MPKQNASIKSFTEKKNIDMRLLKHCYCFNIILNGMKIDLKNNYSTIKNIH